MRPTIKSSYRGDRAEIFVVNFTGLGTEDLFIAEACAAGDCWRGTPG